MSNHTRRVMLMLCSLLLVAVVILPLAVHGALPELGREDRQKTAAWQTVEAAGLRLRLPPTWLEITSEGSILGIGGGHVVAPSCADQPGEGCQAEGAPPLELRWQLERVENRSTPAGDEIRERIEALGFASQAITLGGVPGLLFTASEAYGGVDQAVVIEHGGVYYRLWLSEGLTASGDGDLGPLIMGAIELTPETAPAPFGVGGLIGSQRQYLPLVSAGGQPAQLPRQAAALDAPAAAAVSVSPAADLAARASPAQTISVNPSADPLASASPAQTVSVNPSAVAAYAEAYGPFPWPNGRPNSDDCYVYTTENGVYPYSARCQRITIHTVPRDGAHFIDCALDAGGLTLGCNGNPYNQYVNMQTLYNALTGLPHRLVSQAEAGRGDIFVLFPTSGGVACWGGVILGRTSDNKLRAATHSDDHIDVNPEAAECPGRNSGTPRYIRLNPDEEPPVARFTAPAPGLLAPGPLTLRYDATDLPATNASGVASFALTRTVEGGTPELLVGETTARESALFLDTPCRSVTFGLSAVDNAFNRSPEVSLLLDVGLWGDGDGDGDIDDDDLAAAEAAWGRRDGESGYLPVLDVNGDGRIDTTDLLWIERHRGDRCA